MGIIAVDNLWIYFIKHRYQRSFVEMKTVDKFYKYPSPGELTRE